MDGKKCTQSTKTSLSGDFTNIQEFVDLSQISCDDIKTSVVVGRKFVAKLYDPKARYTCDHGDFNKLRSRIAQQNLDRDRVLYKRNFVENKHNLLNTKFSPYKYIVNPVRNLMTFVHQNKQAPVHFYLLNQIDTFLLLNMTLAVSQLSLYVFCSCGCF
jgi:Ni,Fe-hydrogenase I large subunit